MILAFTLTAYALQQAVHKVSAFALDLQVPSFRAMSQNDEDWVDSAA
jgi:hypothetical protein